MILVMCLSYLSWPNYCLPRALIMVNSLVVTRNTYFFLWSFMALFYKISEYGLHSHLLSHTNIHVSSFLRLCVNVEDRSVCTTVFININVDKGYGLGHIFFCVMQEYEKFVTFKHSMRKW